MTRARRAACAIAAALAACVPALGQAQSLPRLLLSPAERAALDSAAAARAMPQGSTPGESAPASSASTQATAAQPALEGASQAPTAPAQAVPLPERIVRSGSAGGAFVWLDAQPSVSFSPLVSPPAAAPAARRFESLGGQVVSDHGASPPASQGAR